ncbi:MAG: HU family DNA-binding protein [Puniceicoccales bacterium]|jgi:DNA-binding protein HU-beta|nr:HU family DNA-binding protein [Puniceicoccales bacterium]
MNKANLIEEIKRLSGDNCSTAYAERALNNVLRAIMNGIKTTKRIRLIGFGTFSVSKRAARAGVNPKTHAKIHIPASQTVKFKVGSKFKELIAS